MKLGAPVWPFQWNPPYDAALRRIAALGFRAAELIAWRPWVIDDYYTPEQIRSLRSLMDGEGLELSEFVTTAHGLASPDAQARRESVDHLKRTCDTACALGTGMINTVAPMPFALDHKHLKQLPIAQIWTIPVPDGLDWQQNWDDVVATLREVMHEVESRGLRYAMEPHPYRYMSGVDGMLRLMEHVGSPALGVNYDPSHTFPCGDMPHIAVHRLGSRVFHCHFSDNDALTNAHWRPGLGKIDWKALLAALRDTGFDGTLSIELEDVPEVATGRSEEPAGPLFEEEMRLSREYITGLGDELGIAWQ